MSYLMRYKGTYRLKAPYDLRNNQYGRKLNGTLEDIDAYIDCQHGNKVFHYGRSILQAYIPSLIRGHNVLKKLTELYRQDIVSDIEESDSEVLFRFNAKDIEKIIPLLKPRTNGSGISPFSSKNLPKTKYIIPDEDFAVYKNIIKNIPQKEVLGISHMTNDFIRSLSTKKNTYEDIKNDMIAKGLKGKEYIHSIGKWNEYIEFLRDKLKE